MLEENMNSFKTLCQYGYSLLGEKPPLIDNSMEYVIVGEHGILIDYYKINMKQ